MYMYIYIYIHTYTYTLGGGTSQLLLMARLMPNRFQKAPQKGTNLASQWRIGSLLKPLMCHIGSLLETLMCHIGSLLETLMLQKTSLLNNMIQNRSLATPGHPKLLE